MGRSIFGKTDKINVFDKGHILSQVQIWLFGFYFLNSISAFNLVIFGYAKSSSPVYQYLMPELAFFELIIGIILGTFSIIGFILAFKRTKWLAPHLILMALPLLLQFILEISMMWVLMLIEFVIVIILYAKAKKLGALN
ncbi:MAG: hypothetical protein NTZ73_00370 [Candidatus Diapherotrites archaeon]|nr:hypothetical protein [Candidatus Diapherotrites archaeon]